jgi:putative inorganic carbon (HCO3(-)) transporter
MRTREFLTSDYKRTVNLKVAALFAILLLVAFGMSILIADFSTLRVFAAIIGIILFVVIFFNPQVGLMLLFFVIPFEEMVQYPIYKIISLVFLVSWLARKAITKEGIRVSFRFPQERYLIGLFFASTISLAFSIDKASSLLVFQRFVLLIAFCVFLMDTVRSPKDLRNLGWVIGVSGGLASLAGLMQYYVFKGGILAASKSAGVVQEFKGTTGEGIRVAGFTGNPNYFATYLIVSICFLLYCFSMTRNLILRILIIVLIVCSTFSVVLTLSRGGVLALGVAMIIYAKLKGFKFTTILSLLMICLALFFIIRFAPTFVYDRLVNLTFHQKDESSENRAEIIKSSFSMLLEHPDILITGVGLNNFPKVAWMNRDAHNMFLQLLIETGLIGFTFFFLLIYRSYRDIWRGTKLKQAELQLFCMAALPAFTAVLIQGLFNTATYVKYLWLFFVLVVILHNIGKKGYAPA